MNDLQLIGFVFWILFDEVGGMLLPLGLAATALAAAANVRFEPVAT